MSDKNKEPIALTPEEIQAQLDAANEKLAACETENESLKAKLKEKPSGNKELEGELAAAKKIIAKQAQKLEKAEKQKDPNKIVVEYEGKTGIVTIPKFSFEGQVYEAADLQKEENASILARLVEKKSPIVKF